MEGRGIREWEEGVIVPVLKKGEGKKVEEYRGVTLTATLYKVYTGVLADRLRAEVEKKSIIPDNQAGFRKGKSTIDNVYVLNYIVNRNLGKKGEKIVAFVIDLRAAFDMVDREILKRTMEEGIGIEE